MKIFHFLILLLFLFCTLQGISQKKLSGDSTCPMFTGQPSGKTVCQGGAISFPVGISGGITNLFQWQENNGSGFKNISNGGMYQGATSTNLTVLGLSAGMNNYQYRCIVTSGSCDSLISQVAILSVNPAPSVKANAKPVSVCVGSGEQVTLTGSGASTYIWTGGVNNGVPFAPSSTKTYTLTGTDSQGCTATTTITVTVNPLPAVNANTSADSVCQGMSVTFSGSGAQTYTWSGGISNGVPFSPPETSTYTVTGTDLSGCSSSSTVSVKVNPLPKLTLTTSALSVCIGASVTFTAGGGGTYSWNTGSTSSVITVTPDSTTQYSVSIFNGICPNDTGVTITVNKPPVLTISSAQTICAGSSLVLTASGAMTYSWSPSAGLSQNNIASPSASPTTTTTYTVQGFNGACSAKDSVQVSVNPLPTGNACCSTAITLGNSAPLQVGSGTPGATYSWSPSSAVLCDTCPNTTASPTQTTTYTATISSGKCSSTDTLTITVDLICNIFIPNVFSPNGEGMNTKAYVFGLCIKEMDFVIYDKWGNKVFETTDQGVGWDGTYLGQAMDTGDYFYHLSAKTNGNENIQKKGDINLLR